jgi:hypothetical protein
MSTATERVVRAVDVQGSSVEKVANGIEDLYNDKVDIIVVRGALPRETLGAAGDQLDRDDQNPGWDRPNQKMPVEDIQILGTDTLATPTYRAPRGGSLDAYLEGTLRHREEAARVFGPAFNARTEVERILNQFGGGRPVQLPRSADGREYGPFSIRRLVDGTQIGPHFDYHYPLDLYSELRPLVDTSTLVSWVFTVRKPDAGGELVVYGLTRDTPNPPMMPDGFQFDLPAVEKQFHSSRFVTEIGDLFLLASGRCMHRVNRISGPKARVTMGGFLALTTDWQRALYWS